MEVLSLGPLYAAGLSWQRQSRECVLTVVCKATFDLAPGELRLSSGQEPINDSDNHWDDDPRRSVYAPSDMAPFKKGADVTLVGSAHAPQRKPCRSLLARLIVGTIDKAVEVHADRAWSGDAQITDGPAFTHMPLRYERAQGGPGTPNPVGLVIAPGPLPNLHPARRAGTLQDDGSPVGFGPIAASWPQRESRLRRHRGSFSHADWHTRPLPDDIEIEYFNVSPADQRLSEIASDQEIILEHMHPEHTRLVARLPGIKPQAFVERSRDTPRELPLVADALWIDTDRAICTVTWRGQLPLSARDERGRVLIAMPPARQKLGWEDVQRLNRSYAAPKAKSAPPAQSPAAPAAPRAPAAAPAIPPRAPVGPRPADTLPAMNAVVFEEDSVDTAVLSSAEMDVVENVNIPPWLANRLQRPTAQTVPAMPATPQTVPAMPATQAPAASNSAVFPATPQAPAASPAPAPVASPPPLVNRSAPQTPLPPSVAAVVDAQRQTSAESPPPPSRVLSPWAAGAAGAGAMATHTPVAAPMTASPAPSEEPRAHAPVRPARRASVDVVDLLWFDPASAARIRSAFPAIVDELEFEPIDPKHDLPMDDPNASRDRHDVFGVLTRASTTDGRGLSRCMLDSVSETGRFTPPVVAMAGEIRFPFDEVEQLSAMIAAITPLATPENKKLEEALGAAKEVMKTPMLQAPSNVEAVASELRDALRQTKRASTATQLDAHIERVLLEQRKYQKRSVFGDEQIRALFVPAGESIPIPTYMPASLATKLPLVLRMKARVLAEAHAQQDQYESHAHALRVIALGRIVAIEGWR